MSTRRLVVFQLSLALAIAAAGVTAASIDLSGAPAALCRERTGANPVRPHMVLFNRQHSHAMLAHLSRADTSSGSMPRPASRPSACAPPSRQPFARRMRRFLHRTVPRTASESAG